MKESERVYNEYLKVKALYNSLNVLDNRCKELKEDMDRLYNESVKLQNDEVTVKQAEETYNNF